MGSRAIGGHLTLRAVIVFAALLQASLTAHADVFAGRVVAVADGDTLTVLDADRVQHKVRLAGIDAPEKKQPFGQRSRQHLSALAFSKPVEVRWRKRDRYGRLIGTVFAPEAACTASMCEKTVDVSLRQLEAGLAWHYRKYAHEQPSEERERYAAAENVARDARLGLWRDPSPMPPWEWRHR